MMDKKPLIRRKSIVVCIVLLFVGTSIISTTAQDTEKQSTSRGTWLYVGGSGPGNYTRIQDAIDNASDNDTIIVFSGIYFEHIVVNKTLYLMGVNSTGGLPIVDANLSGDAIFVDAPRTTIDGFVTQNSGSVFAFNQADIQVAAQNCTIKNCVCQGVSHHGILINDSYESNFCQITNNTIVGAIWGIHTPGSEGGIRYLNISGNSIIDCGIPLECSGVFQTIIYNNILTENTEGIWIRGHNISVIGNRIYNNREWGIVIYRNYGGKTIVKSNIVSDNGAGILLEGNYCEINLSYNIIISNHQKAGINVLEMNHYYLEIFMNHIERNFPLGMKLVNTYKVGALVQSNNIIHNPVFFLNFGGNFSSNYWGRALNHPKIIFGFFSFIPIIELDRNPAQQPYDIPEMN